MKIVIRVDASTSIGSGHVMRCLTLADGLSKRGADVTFVCREHPSNLSGLIEGNGYQVVLLPQPVPFTAITDGGPYAAFLGAMWDQDAADTIAAINFARPQWLIVDHYAIDQRWETMLRPHVGKIMVIDDLADRRHECDILLDQNLYPDFEARYEKLVPMGCQQLLGPKYVLLRQEFVEARKNLRQRSGKVERILVFFGGVDSTGETEKTLASLAAISERQFDVDIVVGEGNANKLKIQSMCKDLDGFVCHYQANNMAELLLAADLVFGAGGTTTWERCAVGVPSIVTIVSHNQRALVKTCAQEGILLNIGEAHSVTSETIIMALKSVQCFPQLLQLFSEKSLTVVDGKGTDRVVNRLIAPQIILRRASREDCDSVYEWRNAQETRRYIFDSEPILLETHRSWYLDALENPDRILLIGEVDNMPVGVLRYDLAGAEALISVYLVPACHGQGIGSLLIRSGSQWMREHFPQTKVVNAEILCNNTASLRSFESAGFKVHHLTYREVL